MAADNREFVLLRDRPSRSYDMLKLASFHGRSFVYRFAIVPEGSKFHKKACFGANGIPPPIHPGEHGVSEAMGGQESAAIHRQQGTALRSTTGRTGL